MGLKQFFKDHALSIVLALITMTTGIMAFYPTLIENAFFRWFIPIIFAVGFIMQVIKEIRDENKPVRICPQDMDTLAEKQKQATKEDLSEFLDDLKKEKQVEEKEKIDRYASTELLVNLIRENIISIKEVERILPNEKFIVVFCFPFGGPGIPEDIERKRLYQELFEALSFIRLGANYFIIPERNLFPKKLRDIDVLSCEIKKGITLYSNKEWKYLLDKIKLSKHKRLYDNWINEKNPLKFDFLIYKVNMAELRHTWIRGSSFSTGFLRELVSVSNIRNIRLNERDKVSIRDFVLKSSLNILVLGIPSKEKEKILNLEKIFKDELGIINFYDFEKEDESKISAILNRKFEKESSDRYAKILKNRSKEYKEELSLLRII